MLQLVDGSTLSGIHDFTETYPNSKFSASSRPPVTWSRSSAPSCEADHQHLNPASRVAKAAGLGSFCSACAWRLILQWTLCLRVVAEMTLGLVAMQLGELLPEAAPPLLAVCHPKRIKTVSGQMQAVTSHCTGMFLNADLKHTRLNEMFASPNITHPK